MTGPIPNYDNPLDEEVTREQLRAFLFSTFGPRHINPLVLYFFLSPLLLVFMSLTASTTFEDVLLYSFST